MKAAEYRAISKVNERQGRHPANTGAYSVGS
jgi:hypothetical protein